jgi:hypothetical protein
VRKEVIYIANAVQMMVGKNWREVSRALCYSNWVTCICGAPSEEEIRSYSQSDRGYDGCFFRPGCHAAGSDTGAAEKRSPRSGSWNEMKGVGEDRGRRTRATFSNYETSRRRDTRPAKLETSESMSCC